VLPLPNETDVFGGRLWLKRTQKRLADLQAEKTEQLKLLQTGD
jgi:hypothetical protein